MKANNRKKKSTKVSTRVTQATLTRTLKSQRGDDQKRMKAWKTDMQLKEGTKSKEETDFWEKQKQFQRLQKTPNSSSKKKSQRKTRKQREEEKVSIQSSPDFNTLARDSEANINQVIQDAVQATGLDEDQEEFEYEYVLVSSKPQHKIKGFTMGEKTKNTKTEDAPGPGNYELKSRAVEGPEYTIKQKYPVKYESTPGPGDYEKPEETRHGYTIGQKFSEHQTEEMPGPGNYERESKIIEGPQYSMYERREYKAEKTPGPGDYESKELGSKGVTIGTKLKERGIEEMPGPGNYEDRSHIQDGPQYSMYQRRDQKVEQTPGPGDYEDIKTKGKSVTMGQKFATKAPEDIPGPGNYEDKSHILDGPQYSMYQKREQRIEQTPGPGDYENLQKKEKGVTIGQKFKEKGIEEMPGPGNYEGKSHIQEGPQYSMYERRDQKIDQTPGPGDYEESIHKGKGVTISQKFKQREIEDMPGPGNYEERSRIQEGPQYSMYSKREQKIEHTPGPGDYEDIKTKGKSITMSQKFATKEIEDMPGPGNYEGKSHIQEGPQYSMYQKREQRVEQTPGPGDYYEPEHKTQGVTIGAKFKARDPEDVPGPGNYEGISHIQDGPQYSMTQKREVRIEQMPGPGDYEYAQKEEKGVTIGKKFKQRDPEDMPGPGNYEGKSHIQDGPKYSMYQKRDTKIYQTPGPGDYEETAQAQKGVTIGQRLKEKQIEDMPGPGNYEDKTALGEGPQYSMYQKRDQRIEQTPGPGDYESKQAKGKGVSIGQKFKQRDLEDMPGPGNYEDKSHIQEGPQYSMYQKREQRIEQTPGPGDYYEPEHKTQGVTIGTKFKTRDPEDMPGPGNYEDKSHIKDGPQYSMYQRREMRTDQTPGPGDYEYVEKKGKSVTMGQKFATKEEEDMPGPGNYEGKSHIQEGPQYSMYQKREQRIDQTPGPGDYEFIQKQNKGVVMGQKFKNKEPEDMPGPGNYEGKSHIQEGPQYSMYHRREQKVEQTPGPGDYEDIKTKGKGVTIGKKFTQREAEDMPGPGNYEGKSHILEGPQYSMYQRRDQKIEQTPGPGDYEDLQKEGKGVTIGQRLTEKQVEDMPGPGNYEGKSHIQEGPQYSMYHRRDQKIEQTPGPGDYEYKEKKGKGVTIGARIAQKEAEDMPGPGNYEGKTAFGEGPQYSMFERRDQKIEYTPGPGEYEFKGAKGKGVTIGKKFKSRQAEDMPGPGNYEGKSHIQEGPQYSMYTKREAKIMQTPGPGDYETPNTKGKGVSIGKKFKSKQVEDMPGPGNYEQKSRINEGPHYSIYSKAHTKIDLTPGPGDYEEKQRSGKSVTIGKRFTQKEIEDMPGPGNYEQTSKIKEGPQYSMYSKRSQKIEQTPGPGEYEMPKKKSKGLTIGKKFKESEIEELPGPGRYRQKSTIAEGPSFTMTSRGHNKTLDHTPGPGFYNTATSDFEGVHFYAIRRKVVKRPKKSARGGIRSMRDERDVKKFKRSIKSARVQIVQ
ncbi:unnamed protein product [Moneuplotes crassus]|uniref:Uncharacterized protein n=1 Tax=Euplotes crassus TaxID=5936 RepID=A0AAD1Y4Y8_EUPCR|nr:unnamed protein product [Moneuplotes crassus]